tara:strand:+ start:2296 stop:2472 length:177 start_codon:yes stop_codon:yes gene_type:complete
MTGGNDLERYLFPQSFGQRLYPAIPEGAGQFIAFGSAEMIEASVSRCAVTAGRLLKEK